MLQEKLDLRSLKCVNVYTPQNEIAELIGDALKNSDNRSKLKRFIQWFRSTVGTYTMMPDLVGENLFIGIREDGELDIKFVDTKECWDLGPDRDAHNNAQINKMNELMNFLEILSSPSPLLSASKN